MVLHGKPCGRVGRRRDYFRKGSHRAHSQECKLSAGRFAFVALRFVWRGRARSIGNSVMRREESDANSPLSSSRDRIPRMRARGIIALSVPVVLLVGVVAGFGPVVRAKVAREADRRHLVVHYGSARPRWLGVELSNVDVTLAGVEGVRAAFPTLVVSLTNGSCGPRYRGARRDRRCAGRSGRRRGIGPEVACALHVGTGDRDAGASSYAGSCFRGIASRRRRGCVRVRFRSSWWNIRSGWGDVVRRRSRDLDEWAGDRGYRWRPGRGVERRDARAGRTPSDWTLRGVQKNRRRISRRRYVRRMTIRWRGRPRRS